MEHIVNSILSTMLYNQSLINKIKTKLKPNFLKNYKMAKLAYQAILQQKEQNRPLEESLIAHQMSLIDKNSENDNFEFMIKVIAQTPVEDIDCYINIVIENYYNFELAIIARQEIEALKSNDTIQIKILKSKREALEAERDSYQKIEDENIFDDFVISREQLENVKLDYLWNNFIIKNEITMIAARPGNGKSLVSLALSYNLLKDKKVKKVVYFDLDNGLSTLKDRKLDMLIEEHGNNLLYLNGAKMSKNQAIVLLGKMAQMELRDYFIVIDSAKNFLNGGADRDKNKDVSPLMDKFKQLRNKGATVLMLHHNNKKQKDFDSDYAGSSAWEEDVTNSFKLEKNEYRNTFCFRGVKARAGDRNNIAFQFDINTYSLIKVDFDYAKESEEEAAIKSEIINFISSQSQAPSYSQILKYVWDLGFGKDKVNESIQKGKGKYWNNKRDAANNNKDSFYLIKQPIKETEIVFDISNLQKQSDKSDNPDNRIKRGFDRGMGYSDNPDNRIKILDLAQNLSDAENFDEEKIEMPIL